MSDGLALVRAALDREAAAGRAVDVWWRDDDAVRASPALDRLLALAAAHGAPVAVAVVAGRIEPSLPERLGREPGASALVHGFAHANHAPPGAKPAEYGAGRTAAAVAAELATALATVAEAFGPQASPVFVPPWNRIAPEVEAALPGAGYVAVSAFGPAGPPRAGLLRLNAHFDPVDWRGSRSLAPAETVAAALRAALCDETRPALGLLTHHLMFDEALWGWTERLLRLLARHPAVRLRSAPDLLKAPRRSSSLSCRNGSG